MKKIWQRLSVKTPFLKIEASSLALLELNADPNTRYVVTVDITGLDKIEQYKLMKEAHQALKSFFGDTKVCIVPSKDGKPLLEFFELKE